MIVLYRIYQLFVMLPVLLVATIVAALATLCGVTLGSGRWWGYYPAHLWARLFCIMSLVKVTVKGRDNIDPKTSYVFVANHQGAYDIFSIYGYLNHDFRWMMKQELRSIPLVGFTCQRSGHIYVDDRSPSHIKQTMVEAEEKLRGGMSLVVFPEGARTFTGKMRRFKRGAFMLAREFQLPIVPITIDGAFEVLPRTKKIPHWGHITLTIHRPIMPGTTPEEMQLVMQQSKDTIEAALPEKYRNQPAQ